MPEKEKNGEGVSLSRVSIPREQLQIGSVTLSIAAIFLVASIVQALAHTLILSLHPTLISRDYYRWVISALPMYLVAMPLSFLILRLGKASPPEKTERIGIPTLLGFLAICFFLTYAGQLFGNVVNFLIGFFTGHVPENTLESATMDAPRWVNLVFVGILAPVMEELFYRKLVIDRLRRYGDVFAMLSSGIVFGLIHGNFYQFFYAASIGCLFGFVYVRTGRIHYTVILHCVINLFGGVYAAEMLKLLDRELLAKDPLSALGQSPAGAVMLLLYFGVLMLSCIGAVVAAIFFFRRWRRASFWKGSVRPSAREWVRMTLLNPGVYFMCLVIVMLFLNNL